MEKGLNESDLPYRTFERGREYLNLLLVDMEVVDFHYMPYKIKHTLRYHSHCFTVVFTEALSTIKVILRPTHSSINRVAKRYFCYCVADIL